MRSSYERGPLRSPNENFFHISFSHSPLSLSIPELFHTEKSHVRTLKVLDRFFHQPLAAAVKQPLTPANAHAHALTSGGSGAGAQAGLPKDFVESLFPNLGDVIAWHDKANQRMKETVKKHGFPIGKIGSILSDMVSIAWRSRQKKSTFLVRLPLSDRVSDRSFIPLRPC